MDSIQERLLAIEKDLDSDEYRKGNFQSLVRDIERLDEEDRKALAGDVSRVSNKLHARNGFLSFPFALGYCVEVVLFVLSLFLMGQDGLIYKLVGVGFLALSLQPLVKVTTGLLLGVTYEYTYLWFFEPRFKMRYGSYVALPGSFRVILNLVASLPTPVAMWVGYQVLMENSFLSTAALILFFLAVALQIGAFIAELAGLRMVGPFRLSQLTSPATAAAELKKLLARSSQ